MALNIQKYKIDDREYTYSLLQGRSVMKCAWKLGTPMVSLLNGPARMAWDLFQQLKNEGILSKKFSLTEFMTLDIDMKPIINDATTALKELTNSISPDELVDLLLVLFEGMAVDAPGQPNFRIQTGEDFDKAFMGCPSDKILILAIEVMRYNRFPFLRGVTGDFGAWLNKINTLKEELLNGE